MTIHRGREAEKEKVFFLAMCVSCARRVFIYCTTWENENFAHKSQINSLMELMEQFENQTKEKRNKETSIVDDCSPFGRKCVCGVWENVSDFFL